MVPLTIDALVPVKAFDQAKERLAPVLSPAERAALAQAMFLDVLETLREQPLIRRIWVVSASEEVLALAVENGAAGVREPPGAGGLNGSLELGRRAVLVQQHPPEALLVVPADVPAAHPDSLEALLAGLGEGPRVRLCPAPDGGTNALLLRPPGCIPFRYGRGSAERHRHEAEARGIVCELLSIPGFAVDIDTPADLERWLASGSAGRAATLVQTLKRAS